MNSNNEPNDAHRGAKPFFIFFGGLILLLILIKVVMDWLN